MAEWGRGRGDYNQHYRYSVHRFSLQMIIPCIPFTKLNNPHGGCYRHITPVTGIHIRSTHPVEVQWSKAGGEEQSSNIIRSIFSGQQASSERGKKRVLKILNPPSRFVLFSPSSVSIPCSMSTRWTKLLLYLWFCLQLPIARACFCSLVNEV